MEQRISKVPAQDRTRIEALENERTYTKKLKDKVQEIDPNSREPLEGLADFDERKIGVERAAQVSKTQRAAQVLAATTITGSSALLISHAYAAAAQSTPTYPRDAKICYQDCKAESGGQTFCGCAQALSSQDDLNTLAEDLEQTMRLHQQYLNMAEAARDPGV